MRKLIGIILLILLCDHVFSQAPASPSVKSAETLQEKVYKITFSDDAKSFVALDTLEFLSSVVQITSLPQLPQRNIPVKVKFIKGTYHVTAPELKIPEGYAAIMEDMLTGQTYDLSSASPYTFNVNRTIPGRLVIHVNKTSAKITSK